MFVIGVVHGRELACHHLEVSLTTLSLKRETNAAFISRKILSMVGRMKTRMVGTMSSI